jgi:hypothetical protein
MWREVRASLDPAFATAGSPLICVAMRERKANERAPPRMTVGELRPQHLLQAVCGRCGHVGAVDQRRLRRGRLNEARLSALEPLLRCQLCAWKGAGNYFSIGFRPRG